MSRFITALHGFAGAGKDTAALALIDDGWHPVALGINPLIPTPGGEVIHLDRLINDLGWDAAKQNPCHRVRSLVAHLKSNGGMREMRRAR